MKAGIRARQYKTYNFDTLKTSYISSRSESYFRKVAWESRENCDPATPS